MKRRLGVAAYFAGGLALGACLPAKTPKPEKFSQATCADGKPWQGRPCGSDEPHTVDIAPPPDASAAPRREPSPAIEEPAPAFLDLSLDPWQTYPLRAKVRRSGTVYERRDGGVLDAGDEQAVLWTEVVLDPDRGQEASTIPGHGPTHPDG